MPADIETLALPDGEELRAIVPSDDLAPRVGLEAGLLPVMVARAVGLGLECDVAVAQGLGQIQQLLIRQVFRS